MATAREIWARAGLFDIRRGGRFEARDTAVLIWSASATEPSARLVGGIELAFHAPTDGQATVVRLAWDPVEGGLEADVRRALDLLMGERAVPPD